MQGLTTLSLGMLSCREPIVHLRRALPILCLTATRCCTSVPPPSQSPSASTPSSPAASIIGSSSSSPADVLSSNSGVVASSPPPPSHTITRAAAARVVVDLRDDKSGGRLAVGRGPVTPTGGVTGSYLLNTTDGGGSFSEVKSTVPNPPQHLQHGKDVAPSTVNETNSEIGFAGGERMAASVLSPVKPGLLSDDYELFQLVEKRSTEASRTHHHHHHPAEEDHAHHTPVRFEKHADSEADIEKEAADTEEALRNPLSPSDAFYQNLSEDSELDMIKRLRDAKAPFGERLRSTVERWMSRVDGRGQSEALTLLRIHAAAVSVSTTTLNLKTVVESVIPFMLKQPLSSLLLRHAAAVTSDIHAEALKPHLVFVLINARETEMPASEGLFSDAQGSTGKPLACFSCISAQVVDDEFLCVTTKIHYGSKSGLCLLWRTTLFKAELRTGSEF